jgi:hypothetical protein
MPRILRSPGSKSFRLENVSVPNADDARCERCRIRGGLRRSPRGVKAALWRTTRRAKRTLAKIVMCARQSGNDSLIKPQ